MTRKMLLDKRVVFFSTKSKNNKSPKSESKQTLD